MFPPNKKDTSRVVTARLGMPKRPVTVVIVVYQMSLPSRDTY